MSDLELKSLVESIEGQRTQDKRVERPRIIQGGIRFRSICADCNNRLLGREYDPALIEVARNLAPILRPSMQTPLILPDSFEIELKPQRVARAAIGHLLAAEQRENMGVPPVDAPFQRSMREYLLDSSLPLPPQLDIFVWLYPSRRQVIIHGSAYAIFHNMRSAVVGSFIKFFPLGFWITYNRSNEYSIPYERLLADRKISLDATARILFSKGRTPPPFWPESPDDDGMLFFDDAQTHRAEPRTLDHRA